jgi:hypothetical protein
MAAQDLGSVIDHLIQQWLASPSHLELVEVVRISGALPVYMGIGVALLLRSDGEILCFPWDSLGALARESDPGWWITAVVVGAEKYPELRPLLRHVTNREVLLRLFFTLIEIAVHRVAPFCELLRHQPSPPHE